MQVKNARCDMQSIKRRREIVLVKLVGVMFILLTALLAWVAVVNIAGA